MIRSILSEEIWTGSDSNWKQLWKEHSLVNGGAITSISSLIDDNSITCEQKILQIKDTLSKIGHRKKEIKKKLGYLN